MANQGFDMDKNKIQKDKVDIRHDLKAIAVEISAFQAEITVDIETFKNGIIAKITKLIEDCDKLSEDLDEEVSNERG